ncbi:unnamed protein product [Brassicogethes aeneus]|uniref:Uncharacterized protein n=1 Tax=Brassicogethes aeneus TaxID=1431903 RepID=A0A9P0AZ62_BRAAE|nr:unnamed protein product [Brassicogethes aeneus]
MGTNPAKKMEIMTKSRLHKLSAKQYHLLMKKNDENTFTVYFDLQQVQVLFKVPIQETFYATQLFLYYFCVTDRQTSDPVFYTWLETQANKGSNEIGSAVYNFPMNTSRL